MSGVQYTVCGRLKAGMWYCLGAALVCGVAAGVPAGGDAVRLSAEPRSLSGAPGVPLRVVLTAVTERAAPLYVRIPAASNLFVRVVEPVPVRRTEQGHYVQSRTILWQGLEAGTTTITNLLAELGGTTNTFPSIAITITPVEPAEPPPPPPVEEAE